MVTALIVVFILLGSMYTPQELWAPGHLSRFHADITDCALCHQPFVGATTTKCAACHSLLWFQGKSQPEIVRLHQDILIQNQSCLKCHMEHRGVLASVTMGILGNPHGEFIFRVTGANSCSDCHIMRTQQDRDTKPILLNNSHVAHLLEEGEGAHRAGLFASCLKCHIGGQVDVGEDEH